MDPEGYKRIRDSLSAIKTPKYVEIKPAGCYAIINGSKKVPLQVSEKFAGLTSAHEYSIHASQGFGSVRTISIVTGNAVLDEYLQKVTFIRRKRLIYIQSGLRGV